MILEEYIIKYHQVSLFQQNNLVLSDVNLELKSGEFQYLIGSTGSGKSTLLKSMYAEIPIERGEASISGFNLRKIKNTEIPFLRRKIGIVFQDFQLLYDRDVEDNLEFVLKATGWKNKLDRNTRIIEVLSLVGIETKTHKMPNELSGGEQQRLVIARALLNKPSLILADEPTGNLDPKTSDEILSLLHQISKEGTSVIMATHDYRIIEKFPAKVIKCDGGFVQVQV